MALTKSEKDAIVEWILIYLMIFLMVVIGSYFDQ